MSSARGAGLPGVDTSQPLVLTLAPRATPEEVARLCALLEGAPPADVICDVGGLAHADLAAVDALARLRLTAGRAGHRLRFEGAGRELRLLLGLVGLADLLV
ncbi:STAS domain-containing protein [Streptomyces sp. Je 1-79]|uniref:STAS domain-containing protein n=1 Tax=Streptomyces sp. Je 1-79 TaxID=2943847 RepID=UPI0021A52607|nr:STAS domain-containing protein [Streptomyces sp. Je 1-79]MCT4357781.1 STAS domain-containing protein [Streptomyces sp. Je 1-79]